MRFQPTKLAGAYIIDPDPHEDSRGLFARTFCSREFGERGLATTYVQCSTSYNLRRGTVRGLHFQHPPAAEVKLIRCTAGSIQDVIVDIRPDSPTYLQHIAVELTARNRRSLYVPEMFAHGLQTLEDGTEIFYQISEYFAPDKADGLRFNDPKLRISWPLPVTEMTDKDKNWPLLT